MATCTGSTEGPRVVLSRFSNGVSGRVLGTADFDPKSKRCTVAPILRAFFLFSILTARTSLLILTLRGW